MENESIVHRGLCQVADKEYEIFVYSRSGRHFAKTVFSPSDVIISDGNSLDEVLVKHRQLLPLAVNSRQILREFQTPRAPRP